MTTIKYTYTIEHQVLRAEKSTPSREAEMAQMWLSVDPLVEDYPGWSPYNYTLQNPVRLVDPDGRAPDDCDGCPDNAKTGDVVEHRDYGTLTYNGNYWENEEGSNMLGEVMINVSYETDDSQSLSDIDQSDWNFDPLQIIKTNQDGVSLSDGNNGTLPGIDNTVTQTSGDVINLNAGGWLSTFFSSAGRIPNPKKYDVYKQEGFNPKDPFVVINYASSKGVKVGSRRVWQGNSIWLQSASTFRKADSIKKANKQEAEKSYKGFNSYTIDSTKIGSKNEK